MVRKAGKNCVCAVDLFQSDDECEFVLEGEEAERPEEVGTLDDPFGEPVRASHKSAQAFRGLPSIFLITSVKARLVKPFPRSSRIKR
jgi:hypothetical protein